MKYTLWDFLSEVIFPGLGFIVCVVFCVFCIYWILVFLCHTFTWCLKAVGSFFGWSIKVGRIGYDRHVMKFSYQLLHEQDAMFASNIVTRELVRDLVQWMQKYGRDGGKREQFYEDLKHLIAEWHRRDQERMGEVRESIRSEYGKLAATLYGWKDSTGELQPDLYKTPHEIPINVKNKRENKIVIIQSFERPYR